MCASVHSEDTVYIQKHTREKKAHILCVSRLRIKLHTEVIVPEEVTLNNIE